MNLSRANLKEINRDKIEVPPDSVFELPEKVLQFGTGVLLRGLPDYFINKANNKGIFNGRVVIVKSTSSGDHSLFDKQDGLYTVCVRGFHNGKKIEENCINGCVSRVLNAQSDWEIILQCAHNPGLRIIISNTTEVGIQLVHEDIRKHPPASFPGKLLAFLYERFKAFKGSIASGMIIIPTELIPDNGKKLESILKELAKINGLGTDFTDWLIHQNQFCNSLVDRIVPGKPDPETLLKLESELGYTDALLTMCEVYSLWAIEGDEAIRDILSFSQASPGVVIEPDINHFRELKLRILNGTHTLSCGVAILAGCHTVKEAMDDPIVSAFIESLMKNEIEPSIPYRPDPSQAREFSEKVLDRFRNPFIRHLWANITVQYSSKMKMRCIPVLLEHYRKSDKVPELFVTGFAAYLYFMKTENKNGKFIRLYNGEEFPIQDDYAETLHKNWSLLTLPEIVPAVLSDRGFWGSDLSILPGFSYAIHAKLEQIEKEGMMQALENVLPGKVLKDE